MALKDWKKVRSKVYDYRWKNNTKTLEMWRTSMGWYVNTPTLDTKYFKLKSQALRFAKNYMRKH